MITKKAMMKLRRCRWEQLIGWDEQDLARRIEAKTTLPEDIQDAELYRVVSSIRILQ